MGVPDWHRLFDRRETCYYMRCSGLAWRSVEAEGWDLAQPLQIRFQISRAIICEPGSRIALDSLPAAVLVKGLEIGHVGEIDQVTAMRQTRNN